VGNESSGAEAKRSIPKGPPPLPIPVNGNHTGKEEASSRKSAKSNQSSKSKKMEPPQQRQIQENIITTSTPQINAQNQDFFSKGDNAGTAPVILLQNALSDDRSNHYSQCTQNTSKSPEILINGMTLKQQLERQQYEHEQQQLQLRREQLRQQEQLRWQQHQLKLQNEQFQQQEKVRRMRQQQQLRHQKHQHQHQHHHNQQRQQEHVNKKQQTLEEQYFEQEQYRESRLQEELQHQQNAAEKRRHQQQKEGKGNRKAVRKGWWKRQQQVLQQQQQNATGEDSLYDDLQKTITPRNGNAHQTGTDTASLMTILSQSSYTGNAYLIGGRGRGITLDSRVISDALSFLGKARRLQIPEHLACSLDVSRNTLPTGTSKVVGMRKAIANRQERHTYSNVSEAEIPYQKQSSNPHHQYQEDTGASRVLNACGLSLSSSSSSGRSLAQNSTITTKKDAFGESSCTGAGGSRPHLQQIVDTTLLNTPLPGLPPIITQDYDIPFEDERIPEHLPRDNAYFDDAQHSLPVLSPPETLRSNSETNREITHPSFKGKNKQRDSIHHPVSTRTTQYPSPNANELTYSVTQNEENTFTYSVTQVDDTSISGGVRSRSSERSASRFASIQSQQSQSSGSLADVIRQKMKDDFEQLQLNESRKYSDKKNSRRASKSRPKEPLDLAVIEGREEYEEPSSVSNYSEEKPEERYNHDHLEQSAAEYYDIHTLPSRTADEYRRPDSSTRKKYAHNRAEIFDEDYEDLGIDSDSHGHSYPDENHYQYDFVDEDKDEGNECPEFVDREEEEEFYKVNDRHTLLITEIRKLYEVGTRVAVLEQMFDAAIVAEAIGSDDFRSEKSPSESDSSGLLDHISSAYQREHQARYQHKSQAPKKPTKTTATTKQYRTSKRQRHVPVGNFHNRKSNRGYILEEGRDEDTSQDELDQWLENAMASNSQSMDRSFVGRRGPSYHESYNHDRILGDRGDEAELDAWLEEVIRR